ncbi:hypothetical protein R8N68_01660 [Vibrio sp. 1974]|uniref:hypothetical protein n=1 Tax=Vibrio sp. 1974 TaxID=3074584 RepID=UPI002966F12E|nr:hypothetical protein [Vibrio sp. 1974]MDF4385727.1 hypothetical protein [Vibrio parahaemolyticus]MDW3119754.1 hypothetical protein [Vibrio sp. 1974]
MHKEFFKPVAEAITHRMKSPLVGTFILSWVLINHSFLLEFIFSSLDSKVMIAKESRFSLTTDLIYPFGLTLLYLVVVPAIQLGVDWLVLNTLGESRKKHDSLVSRNAVVSTQEYQQRLMNEQFTAWDTDRTDLLSQIDNLKKEVESSRSEYKELKNKHGALEMQYEAKDEAIDRALQSLQRHPLNQGSDYADSRDDQTVIDDTIKILEEVNPPRGEFPF